MQRCNMHRSCHAGAVRQSVGTQSISDSRAHADGDGCPETDTPALRIGDERRLFERFGGNHESHRWIRNRARSSTKGDTVSTILPGIPLRDARALAVSVILFPLFSGIPAASSRAWSPGRTMASRGVSPQGGRHGRNGPGLADSLQGLNLVFTASGSDSRP